MGFPEFLVSITVRTALLAAVAGAAMWVWRARSAAAKHAVWTVVAGGMLLTPAFAPLLPELPLRVLRAAPAPVALPEPAAVGRTADGGAAPARGNAREPRARLDGGSVVAVVYLLGLLVLLVRLVFGYSFTRRLVRASRPIGRPWSAGIFESAWISVPLTVGWLRPKILLPADWASWPAGKLDAVLAHERAHIRRCDWAISVMAGLNRCIFWFHPLASWVERRLALLAEQACDDSALLLVGAEPYAQALLDMAAAVRSKQGRLVWEAMAMAEASEVKKRIERVLDETRQIPKALTPRRWMALVACSLPVAYLAMALKPAPVRAQPQQFPGAAALEQRLAANPHDLEARRQLILGYFANNVREPRLGHVYWLIANHPESQVTAEMSFGITARATSMNDATDYARAAGLWKQQAALHDTDARVLGNAGLFFSQPGGDLSEAARLLSAAVALTPKQSNWVVRLAKVYARAILSTAGDSAFDARDSALGQRAKTEIESSTDPLLKTMTVFAIRDMVRRPAAGETLPPGTLDLDQHAVLVPIVQWAQALTGSSQGTPAALVAPTTAPSLGAGPPPVSKVEPEYPALARQARISGTVHLIVTVGPDGRPQHLQVRSGHPLLVPSALEAVKQWAWDPAAAGTFEVDVPFVLHAAAGVGGVPHETAVSQAMALGPAPISTVEPEYPPLARQARISGVVHLSVTVGKDGNPEKIDVQGGHPLLVPAAMEAVRRWKWEPSAAGSFEVDVPFRLQP
jgi:TonB family protein